MTNIELIESMIAVNARNKDVQAAAKRLYNIFGSFNALVEAESGDIADLGGISAASGELISMIPDIARYRYCERTRDMRDLSNCRLAGEYLKMTYLGKFNEMMYALALDEDGRLIKRMLVQEGTVDETSVHMRKIMECALLSDASVLVISHNHPGGSFAASMDDYNCTRLVAKTIADYDITLVDHIVVADGKAHSMALMGQVPQMMIPKSEKVRNLLNEWAPESWMNDVKVVTR